MSLEKGRENFLLGEYSLKKLTMISHSIWEIYLPIYIHVNLLLKLYGHGL